MVLVKESLIEYIQHVDNWMNEVLYCI